MNILCIKLLLPGKAPICCVIAPNSDLAIDAFLKVSNKVVFPWSTWPIIVTTGCLKTVESYGAGGLKIIVIIHN